MTRDQTTERPDAKFAAAVIQQCLVALVARGFRRVRKDKVDWPIDADFSSWVGLNRGLHVDRVTVNPFVGLHAIRIEMEVARLDGEKYPGPHGPFATYALHLGELDRIGDAQAFAFAPSQRSSFIDAECDRLAELFYSVGLEYSRSIASYNALLPLLQQRVNSLGGAPERLACCLRMMRRDSEAESFVRDFMNGEPDYFEPFGNAFLDDRSITS